MRIYAYQRTVLKYIISKYLVCMPILHTQGCITLPQWPGMEKLQKAHFGGSSLPLTGGIQVQGESAPAKGKLSRHC